LRNSENFVYPSVYLVESQSAKSIFEKGKASTAKEKAAISERNFSLTEVCS